MASNQCAVSRVIDYYRETRPADDPNWNWEAFYKLQDIVRRMERLDTDLHVGECVDERKDKFLADIEQVCKTKFPR